MQAQPNKETFKLLQLSDDSRSLSDLELPEVTTQRKKKVRRKTRPRPHTNRQIEDINSDSQCSRLIVYIAIFLISCWLLTLSYMLAVIHAESTRCQVQIKKVAITSQNVPDALQKWHEASKSLEQNQTAINAKLLEVQHFIDELRSQFSMYETKLNEKKDCSKDEKFVADFGAEIKAVSADIERIKERFDELQKDQNSFRSDVDMLKKDFGETVMNATRLANNNVTNYSDELRKAQITVINEIKSLSGNLNTVNDTLSQKARILTDDQRTQKVQIDVLQERVENITSHVDSIEINWNQNKVIVSDLDTFKNNSNYEIQSLKNITNDLKNAVENVRTEIFQSISHNQDKSTTAKDGVPEFNDTLKLPEIVGPAKAVTSTKSTSSLPAAVTQPSTTTAASTNTMTANNATNFAAATVEGKPKLLSIQTISKPL